MMATLGEKLRTLYPNAISPIDFRVVTDADGSRIAYWDQKKLGPQPSKKQIDAVTDQQVAAFLKQ